MVRMMLQRATAAWGGQLADWATTVAFLAHGGTEGNPLLQPVIGSFWGFFSIKVVATAMVITMVARLRPTTPRIQKALILTLTAAALSSVFAVTWNTTSWIMGLG